MPAESEGIADRVADVALDSVIWRVIEVAARVGEFVIDGGGYDAVPACKDGRDCLDGAGGAQEVSRHRFR